MERDLFRGIVLVAVLLSVGCETLPAEKPYGRGMTEANKERLVIDDMEDVSDWYYAKEEDSKLTTSSKHVKEGKSSLLFSTHINHKGGQKNYPIGWPRTGKRLQDTKMTDWSDYDFFECWIYTETSRDALPSTPFTVAFCHSGHRNSTPFRLKELKKNEWVKIVIPISKLKQPKDVQSLQFHINESDYKHDDQVDFYIDDMVLTRFIDPTIVTLDVNKKLIYASDRQISATYSLSGYKGMDKVTVELEIGRGITAPVAKGTAKAAKRGEVSVAMPAQRVVPGTYWARLSLRDAEGKLIDRKQVEFRVLTGPF
ncbi:MAG: hypothetical protein GXP25_12655 [Planctomycetes bacterium]|nr:hypothetical protein [Planctomycetota bacterium]